MSVAVAAIATDAVTVAPRPHRIHRIFASLTGWPHTRHLVLPGDTFRPLEAVGPAEASPVAGVLPVSVVPHVPLSWVLETFLGGGTRDVALLLLRSAGTFDIWPWTASGRHVRRFARVQLEAGGSVPDSPPANCEEVVRWAAGVGYGLLRGRCHGKGAGSELVFERLG
mmetsp:Transcript_41095/g.127370  ORF Transcript_41095/g.127370 Transcript_41095/m.127370 type:complete len:168 (-) Transcript_41095:47-550(-)